MVARRWSSSQSSSRWWGGSKPIPARRFGITPVPTPAMVVTMRYLLREGVVGNRRLTAEIRAGEASGATRTHLTKPVLVDSPEADEILGSLQVFPPDSPWNRDVSGWPVRPDSRAVTDVL